jgi:hypothetical protein
LLKNLDKLRALNIAIMIALSVRRRAFITSAAKPQQREERRISHRRAPFGKGSGQAEYTEGREGEFLKAFPSAPQR